MFLVVGEEQEHKWQPQKKKSGSKAPALARVFSKLNCPKEITKVKENFGSQPG